MDISPEFIAQNKLSYDEIHALQRCLEWEKLSKKYFPDDRLERLPKKGNLRKNILFRYCLKMVKMLESTFRGYEISLFMIAQFESFILYRELFDSGCITPACLTSEKSMWRYKKWKKQFDGRTVYSADKKRKTNMTIVQNELLKSLSFLEALSKDYQKLEYFLSNQEEILKYIILGKMTTLYVIASPFVAKLEEGKKEDAYKAVNYEMYKEYLTDEVLDLHKKIFYWEWQ